jgi:hypothetical protein
MTKDIINHMEVGIAVDRPCSGTVLPNSSILLSLTRSTYTDDGKGLTETVNSQEKLTIKHVLIFGKDILKLLRNVQINNDLQPQILVRSTSTLHEHLFDDLGVDIIRKIQKLKGIYNSKKVYIHAFRSFDSVDADLEPSECKFYITITNMNDDSMEKIDNFSFDVLDAFNLKRVLNNHPF